MLQGRVTMVHSYMYIKFGGPEGAVSTQILVYTPYTSKLRSHHYSFTLLVHLLHSAPMRLQTLSILLTLHTLLTRAPPPHALRYWNTRTVTHLISKLAFLPQQIGDLRA